MAYKSINPLNNIQTNQFDVIDDNCLQTKIEKAHQTYLSWRNTTFGQRKKVLIRLGELLLKNKESLAKTITLEMGKPISQAIAEVEKSASVCSYYANNSKRFLQAQTLESSAKNSQVWYEPIGIVFAIMPWNFPFWQVFRFIAPNVMLGNVGLLKHASNVPQCANSIEQLFNNTKAPEGLFQNLFIDYNQVESVIQNPYVQGVTFTGSNNAGSKVAALAGEYIKKSVLELGGSDPFIIFDGANIEKAVEFGIDSRFLNNGQSCIAAKRFIVQDSIYDQFIKLFIEKVSSLKIGNPLDKEVYIGPIARESFLIELEQQVSKTLKMGSRLLYGGKRDNEYSSIYLPTIVDEIPESAPLLCEEVFGPVAPVCKFTTTEEAIKMANNTNFGLGASVWNRDIYLALDVAKQIETGTVAINGMVKSESNLPFGGAKDSGYGCELSEFGLKEFANLKTVSIF